MSETKPEITKPAMGELRLCVWTGTSWYDLGLNFEIVRAVLKEQHAALESLLVKNIARDPLYYPTQQPEWLAVVRGSAVIKALTVRPGG